MKRGSLCAQKSFGVDDIKELHHQDRLVDKEQLKDMGKVSEALRRRFADHYQTSENPQSEASSSSSSSWLNPSAAFISNTAIELVISMNCVPE